MSLIQIPKILIDENFFKIENKQQINTNNVTSTTIVDDTEYQIYGPQLNINYDFILFSLVYSYYKKGLCEDNGKELRVLISKKEILKSICPAGNKEEKKKRITKMTQKLGGQLLTTCNDSVDLVRSKPFFNDVAASYCPKTNEYFFVLQKEQFEKLDQMNDSNYNIFIDIEKFKKIKTDRAKKMALKLFTRQTFTFMNKKELIEVLELQKTATKYHKRIVEQAFENLKKSNVITSFEIKMNKDKTINSINYTTNKDFFKNKEVQEMSKKETTQKPQQPAKEKKSNATLDEKQPCDKVAKPNDKNDFLNSLLEDFDDDDFDPFD